MCSLVCSVRRNLPLNTADMIDRMHVLRNETEACGSALARQHHVFQQFMMVGAHDVSAAYTSDAHDSMTQVHVADAACSSTAPAVNMSGASVAGLIYQAEISRLSARMHAGYLENGAGSNAQRKTNVVPEASWARGGGSQLVYMVGLVLDVRPLSQWQRRTPENLRLMTDVHWWLEHRPEVLPPPPLPSFLVLPSPSPTTPVKPCVSSSPIAAALLGLEHVSCTNLTREPNVAQPPRYDGKKDGLVWWSSMVLHEFQHPEIPLYAVRYMATPLLG